jgi:hypothetical protein
MLMGTEMKEYIGRFILPRFAVAQRDEISNRVTILLEKYSGKHCEAFQILAKSAQGDSFEKYFTDLSNLYDSNLCYVPVEIRTEPISEIGLRNHKLYMFQVNRLLSNMRSNLGLPEPNL